MPAWGRDKLARGVRQIERRSLKDDEPINFDRAMLAAVLGAVEDWWLSPGTQDEIETVILAQAILYQPGFVLTEGQRRIWALAAMMKIIEDLAPELITVH